MKRYDAVVLGAGPAGSCIAAELASNGWKVLLADKSVFPRHKVCGGFIAPENRAWLERKGVWQKFIARGAHPIRKVWLTAPGRVSLRMHFPGEACGLAVQRCDFDQALADLAVRSGAEMRATCKLKSRHENYGIFQSANQMEETVESGVWIDARGAAQTGRPAAFGMMAVFENVKWIRGQVVLHFAEGGHFGLNQVTGNSTAVCYLAEKPLISGVEGDLEKLFAAFKKNNPFLGRQMQGAIQTAPWRGISVPATRPPRFFDGRTYFAGDAAAVVNSIVGGGIAAAIQGGLMLAQALIDSPQAAAIRYENQWRKMFQAKAGLSHYWSWLSHRPWAAGAVLGFLSANKKIFRTIFDWHHPHAGAAA